MQTPVSLRTGQEDANHSRTPRDAAPRRAEAISLAHLDTSPSGAVLNAAGDLLRVIAAPVRIAIVLHLNESPRYVRELADALQTPQSLISQHLRILKAARVVAAERAGREVMYRLVDDHLARIVIAAVIHAAEDPP